MSPSCDRRTFLARIGRVGLVAPVLPLAGCTVVERPESEPAEGEGAQGARAEQGAASGRPGVLTRPVLRSRPDGSVHIAAPLRELPMAYVSTGLLQVFVDYDYRDRARFLLDAHISVSTGLWRIRLPGDPENRFVVPGDTSREFEELDIAAWDPSMPPAEGDFRVVRGSPATVRIDFDCIATAGGDAWLSGGPWEIHRCDGLGDEACREDFMEIGVGMRRPVRGCEDAGTEARFLTWARRE